MNQKENLLDIVKLIWQKRKTIIYACLIAAVCSAIISLLIPNTYKSETVFYAANPTLGAPSPLVAEGKVVNQYGNNRDLDRLFAIAKSSEIFELLNSKFDFFTHYKIDSTGNKAKSKLRKKFKKNFHLLKTEYDAFSLSFEDKDPQFSADVANEARNQIDFLAQSIIKLSQGKQISSKNDNLIIQQKNLKQLVDSLTSAKNKYSIFNVKAQEEAMAEIVTNINFDLDNYLSKETYYRDTRKNRDSLRKYQSLVATTQNEIALRNDKINNFNTGSNIIKILDQKISSATSQLNMNTERLKKLKSTYNSPFNAIHVIEKGHVPNIKHGPKRSIYVIATTMLTFIFSILTLLILNTYKKVDWSSFSTGK